MMKGYTPEKCKMFLVVLLFSIISFPLECKGRIHEPSCGYMDSLEKVLEKNVRNEHKLSIFSDALAAWETKLDKKLKELDKAESARNNQIDDIKDDTAEMKQTFAETSMNLQQEFEQIKTRLDAKEKDISQTLADELRKHEEALQSFQEAYKTPTVVFTARDISNKDVLYNEVIKFTTIVNNVGGAYDTNTGTFTAPYDGLYLFHATVCAWHQKSVIVHLVVAGTAMGSTRVYNHSADGTCTSINGIATLSKGDKAWVQGASSNKGALYVDANSRWPTFSGILVHT